MTFAVLVWIFIFTQIGIAQGAYSAAKETEIRGETILNASYDSVSRPVAQTVVKVGLSVLAIDELDLKSQKFSAAGWLTLEWTDSRITWTPSAKDDIEVIYADMATIWKPEIVIDNSLDDLGVINDEYLQLRADYTGTVEWEPMLLFNAHCQVDITFYPYDQQKCGIDVVSWGYAYEEVKFEALKSEANLEDFETHGEWRVDKSTTELKNLTETTSTGAIRTHPQITFWLYMERRTEFYNLNIMVPIFMTSLLAILVFIVPIESGEKISYVLTVFLSLAVLLTVVADALPATSISTSVLGVYLAVVSIMSGIACFLTVIILVIYHKEGSPPEDSTTMDIVRGLAKFTCTPLPDPVIELSRLSTADTNKVAPNDKMIRVKSAKPDAESLNGDDSEVTWQSVAMLTDKFCFYIFAVVTVITNIIFLMTLTIGGTVNSPD